MKQPKEFTLSCVACIAVTKMEEIEIDEWKKDEGGHREKGNKSGKRERERGRQCLEKRKKGKFLFFL